MDETAKQLFDRQFAERLKDFLTLSPGTTVLLVPSINDVISDHAVFPQCELEPEFSSDPVNFIFVHLEYHTHDASHSAYACFQILAGSPLMGFRLQ